MSHIQSLEFITQFNTQGRAYKPRTILPGREELELVLGGRACFTLADKTIPLHAGDLVWHKEGDSTIFSNQNSDDYECIILSFSVSEMHSPLARVRHWSGKISLRQFVEDALDHLDKNQQNPEFAEYLYTACKIHTHPIQIHNSTLTFSAETAYNTAIQTITEHFNKPTFNVAKLAEVAHVSTSTLHQIFKDQTGNTPHFKILQFRMDHACALLAENRPLKQVAAQCGFESESGFSRAFKKYFKCSANEFRKTDEGQHNRMVLPETSVL
jgi:AraC-like DNA-binding protein